jgi:phospholipase C
LFLKFIEDNWQTGRIGNHSYDDIAGTIQNAFDFAHLRTDNLILDPNREMAAEDVT